MTVFLIIISLYGGIERVPMTSEAACETARKVFTGMQQYAKAYCIQQ